jgi:hypothetical protein
MQVGSADTRRLPGSASAGFTPVPILGPAAGQNVGQAQAPAIRRACEPSPPAPLAAPHMRAPAIFAPFRRGGAGCVARRRALRADLCLPRLTQSVRADAPGKGVRRLKAAAEPTEVTKVIIQVCPSPGALLGRAACCVRGEEGYGVGGALVRVFTRSRVGRVCVCAQFRPGTEEDSDVQPQLPQLEIPLTTTTDQLQARHTMPCRRCCAIGRARDGSALVPAAAAEQAAFERGGAALFVLPRWCATLPAAVAAAAAAPCFPLGPAGGPAPGSRAHPSAFIACRGGDRRVSVRHTRQPAALH